MNLQGYALFAGEKHYPLGGLRDYRISAGTINECKEWFEKNALEIADSTYIDIWGQIVHLERMEIIEVIKLLYLPFRGQPIRPPAELFVWKLYEGEIYDD